MKNQDDRDSILMFPTGGLIAELAQHCLWSARLGGSPTALYPCCLLAGRGRIPLSVATRWSRTPPELRLNSRHGYTEEAFVTA